MKYILTLLTFWLTATTTLFSLDPLEPEPIKLHHKRDKVETTRSTSEEPKKHVTFAQKTEIINTTTPQPTIIESPISEKSQPLKTIVITPATNNINDTPHDNPPSFSLKTADVQEKKSESKMPGEIAQGKPKKTARAVKKQNQLSDADNVAKESNAQDKKSPVLDSVFTKQSLVKRFAHNLAGAIAFCSAWDYIFLKTGTLNWAAKPVYIFAADSKLATLNKISRAKIIYGLSAGAVLLGIYKIIFSYCTPETEEEIF